MWLLWIGVSAFAADRSLTVETWNVGIAHGFVDNAAARLPYVVEELAEADADILCLQEAWDPADRAILLGSLEASYPFAFSTEVTQYKASRAPVCKSEDLFGDGKFVSCLLGPCGGTSGDAKTACIIDQCGAALTDLKNAKPECAQSLMAQVGKSSAAAMWNILRPTRKAGLFAYHGSDGLLMLSRRPLTNERVVDFTDISTLNRRRALVAEVPVGDRQVTVACTHLTADLSALVPYPGAFPGWAAEAEAQAERLVDAVGRTGPAVLLGDFNCGSADEAHGLVEEAPGVCEAIVGRGFGDPASTLWPACTWCATNTHNVDGGEHINALIDHVFVRGMTPVSGMVSHDAPVMLKIDRQEVSSSLSDHFGYRMVLGLPASE